jgi:hypothetical protein
MCIPTVRTMAAVRHTYCIHSIHSTVSMIKLLTDTISLTIHEGKLVPMLNFIYHIDVRNGGIAPHILAEQVASNGKICDSHSRDASLTRKPTTLTEVYRGFLLSLQADFGIVQYTGTRPSFFISIPVYLLSSKHPNWYLSKKLTNSLA